MPFGANISSGRQVRNATENMEGARGNVGPG